tara:strand:- start:104061 stop:105926 length:1866 start_codon:yes stop_codon:yes gene_type:complete
MAGSGLSATAIGQDRFSHTGEALNKEFARIGIVERHVMMPMRDGIGLASDIYRPKEAKGPVPVIFVKQPYHISDMKGLGLQIIVDAVAHGYAVVFQTERGRYYSEGKWEILGNPRTDGYDALTWLAKQPWSNGKVGTWGCSSSAEWQLALAAQHHPAHAAMVPMSAGAGIGEVGPFKEQGNWYTGGAPRMLFTSWLYQVSNGLRPSFVEGLTGKQEATVAHYNSLIPTKAKVDWSRKVWHLPVSDILDSLNEPKGTFDEFIKRQPADPAWRKGGLYRAEEAWGVPALWFNAWYDVSIGPNLALYNHLRGDQSNPDVSENQYMVVAPVTHCKFFDMGPDAKVGEMPVGDTSFDSWKEVISWFDYWLKGDKKAFAKSTPHVRYFLLGRNKWMTASQWPPRDNESARLYLHSKGKANSLYGDGRLDFEQPIVDEPADSFTYDPMNPVQTIGGGECCNGGQITAGAFDQRVIEARHDVLVYTTKPLEMALDVVGFVQPVLEVASDAPDTDFTVKLVDVAPDGTAYIIGDTILRVRFREGYDKEALMKPDGVYRLKPTPIATAMSFQPGHSIRIEISSSNFPKYYRNLNIAGNSSTSTEWRTARNSVFHDPARLSYIELPILKQGN